MSVEQTLKERGTRYGDFTDHAQICQDLMRVMQRAKNQNSWPDLSDVQRQALTVIADKIARILSGDPDYADNWHDIQGYARLVEERLPVLVGATPASCCPDCGAPEGDLHYVLCPRLPVPEEHAKAVEEAFAAEQFSFKPITGQEFKDACAAAAKRIDAQFDETRADIIGQNGNDGEHYAVPAGVDINDWRTWQVGDKLECIEEYSDGDYTEDRIARHEIVTVVEVEPREYGGDLPVKVQGTAYFGWPNHEDYAAEECSQPLQLFRFHHRPAKTGE